ncbi:hypothetical protein C8F01DRAFT_1230701 [Mycena amicta]|nr:hypothetical protein C8F01DRAFT_1230701 [Mycena amicta]
MAQPTTRARGYTILGFPLGHNLNLRERTAVQANWLGWNNDCLNERLMNDWAQLPDVANHRLPSLSSELELDIAEQRLRVGDAAPVNQMWQERHAEQKRQEQQHARLRREQEQWQREHIKAEQREWEERLAREGAQREWERYEWMRLQREHGQREWEQYEWEMRLQREHGQQEWEKHLGKEHEGQREWEKHLKTGIVHEFNAIT